VLLHYGYVDARLNRFILCCDNARFINHSAAPNLVTDHARDRYGVDVARRHRAGPGDHHRLRERRGISPLTSRSSSPDEASCAASGEAAGKRRIARSGTAAPRPTGNGCIWDSNRRRGSTFRAPMRRR
jgi:hypothetical protein